MALKHYNPKTPGTRQLVLIDRSALYKGKPVKALTEGKSASGGRNNTGRTVVRFRGGGHKQSYRIVDFRRSKHDMPYQYFPSLEALAEWCSVLMIAVRAGSDTHHAVDANILNKLGKDGFVVNISRGSVIDQQALVAALTDKTIAGAGLDVYEKEPHAPDALTAFPNVVLTPHIGGHTIEAHVAMQNCVIANLEAVIAGKPLPYEVRGA